MRKRTWAIFLLVNVIVSATVMLTILFICERVHTPASSPPPPATATRVATPPATGTAAATGAAAASATPMPIPSPTPPGPLLYTVQEGDTLGAIAQMYDLSVEDLMAANGLSNPHVLQVGQTLVIPVASPVAPADVQPAEPAQPPATAAVAAPTPLPTLTPSGPSLVEIGQVLGSGNLATEVVIIRNRGGTATLEGWTLSDAEGNVFTFPAMTLFTDAQVHLHSTAGSPTPSDLYWGRTASAWIGGTLITLRDSAGSVVDTYIVP